MVASYVELIPKPTQFLSKFKTQNVIKSKTCIFIKNKNDINKMNVLKKNRRHFRLAEDTILLQIVWTMNKQFNEHRKWCNNSGSDIQFYLKQYYISIF